jgi:hypothetical protein
MKRIILLGMMLMSIVLSNAQSNIIDIGIQGSPSVIFLRGDNFSYRNYKPIIGFSSGLSADLNLTDFFSIVTGLSFERKGSQAFYQVIDDQGTPLSIAPANSYLDYLAIPVLLRFNLGKNVKFYFNVGAYLGYLFNQSYVNKDKLLPSTTNFMTPTYRNFDTGFSSGIGIKLPMKKRFYFSMEIRNNLGLYNILPNNSNSGVKTNSTNLLIGIFRKF